MGKRTAGTGHDWVDWRQKYKKTEMQKYSVVFVRFQIYLGNGVNDMVENG